MQRPDRSMDIVSNTFFISQLAAIGLFGASAALEDLLAEDFFAAGLALFAVVFTALAVVLLRLPHYFASRLSLGSLSFIAILSSLFTAVFSYVNAASYFQLPPALSQSGQITNLRLVAFLGFGAFTLALIANVIAAAVAVTSQRRTAS